MVNTRKFSEMVADTLQEGQEAAGLNAGGQNAIMTVNLQFSPSGTTAQRPALPATPTIRYNTDLNAFEFWNGSTWFTISSASAGGANGEIQFNNLGTLDGDGNFTTNGAGVITIAGQLNVDNLRADGNEISAQNVNGSIVLTPNGSGIVQVPAPTLDLSAATKKYVDDIASGFQFLNPVRMSTTANFVSVYNNGAGGVGATLTASSVGAFTADGVTGNLNDRVLVPNQSSTLENGIYVLTTVGDGATQAVLTRATDFDESDEIDVNELVSVSEGTTRGGQLWRVTSANPVIGTDPITFVLFGVDPNDVMTLSTNQTVTGEKTFNDFILGNDGNADGNNIINLAEPINPQDAATKFYVDSKNGAGLNNIFIAGDFDTNPWQRGTSFPAAVAGAYHADRWRTSYTTSAVMTMAKIADAPTVAQADYFTQHCLGMEVTTADTTIAATDICYHLQLVEGYNFLPIAQRESTISFWVKATVTGIYCFVCHNAAADMSFIAEYTVNASNTWEYKTVVVPASPVAGTWNYTNGTGITCQFIMASGSNFYGVTGWQAGGLYATANQVNALGTIGNIWRLALVKWEIGSVATRFVGRTIQEELKLCQRYYWKSFPQGVTPVQNVGNLNGAIAYRAAITGVNNAGDFVRFPQDMRATPTLTSYNPLAASTSWYNQSLGASSGSFSASSNSSTGFYANNVQVGGDGAGNFIGIHVTAESEL